MKEDRFKIRKETGIMKYRNISYVAIGLSFFFVINIFAASDDSGEWLRDKVQSNLLGPWNQYPDSFRVDYVSLRIQFADVSFTDRGPVPTAKLDRAHSERQTEDRASMHGYAYAHHDGYWLEEHINFSELNGDFSNDDTISNLANQLVDALSDIEPFERPEKIAGVDFTGRDRYLYDPNGIGTKISLPRGPGLPRTAHIASLANNKYLYNIIEPFNFDYNGNFLFAPSAVWRLDGNVIKAAYDYSSAGDVKEGERPPVTATGEFDAESGLPVYVISHDEPINGHGVIIEARFSEWLEVRGVGHIPQNKIVKCWLEDAGGETYPLYEIRIIIRKITTNVDKSLFAYEALLQQYDDFKIFDDVSNSEADKFLDVGVK